MQLPRQPGSDRWRGHAHALARVDVAEPGQPGASASDLLALVYADLHAAAQAALCGERPNHTLQPTALIHEAYLRLASQSRANWSGPTHFRAVAAEAMRRVLVDHARTRGRFKRGGGARRVELDASTLDAGGTIGCEELEDALRVLEGVNQRAAAVVVLRFYGGLSIAEAALALGASETTIEREWRFARAWLFDRLARDGEVR